MKTICCKTCFWKWRFEKKNWCRLIEQEHGGSILADKKECEYYLRKGTEPKMLCWKCGRNTFGESSVGEGRKHWCYNCHSKKEAQRWEKQKALKLKENIAKVTSLLGGDVKKATYIMRVLKL